MAVIRGKVVVITGDGTAQKLAIPTGTSGRLRKISFTPGVANAAPVGLGFDNTVNATTAYGILLPAASGGVPPAPYEEGEFEDGTMFADDYWHFVAVGEKLHVAMRLYFDRRGVYP